VALRSFSRSSIFRFCAKNQVHTRARRVIRRVLTGKVDTSCVEFVPADAPTPFCRQTKKVFFGRRRNWGFASWLRGDQRRSARVFSDKLGLIWPRTERNEKAEARKPRKHTPQKKKERESSRLHADAESAAASCSTLSQTHTFPKLPRADSRLFVFC